MAHKDYELKRIKNAIDEDEKNNAQSIEFVLRAEIKQVLDNYMDVDRVKYSILKKNGEIFVNITAKVNTIYQVKTNCGL